MLRSMAGVCYSGPNEKAMMKISNDIHPLILITHKKLWMTSTNRIPKNLGQPTDWQQRPQQQQAGWQYIEQVNAFDEANGLAGFNAVLKNLMDLMDLVNGVRR